MIAHKCVVVDAADNVAVIVVEHVLDVMDYVLVAKVAQVAHLHVILDAKTYAKEIVTMHVCQITQLQLLQV
jgi:hypothetical protein